jgi:CRISPR-associated protein Cas5h
MKAISFTLSGRFAHFKKPDVNSYVYFTYSHIHKVALLGVFGAILGLKGYGNSKGDYPEFYEKLQNFKISIIPKKSYFTKKIVVFNNSVGYASKEEGGNLIVREQWLEKPSWEILVLENDSSEFKALKERLFKKECAYIPYLGKNDHFANIDNIKEVSVQKPSGDLAYISLIKKETVVFKKSPRFGKSFFYEEYLPWKLKKKYLIYEYNKMMLSSWVVECKDGLCFEMDKKGVWFG